MRAEPLDRRPAGREDNGSRRPSASRPRRLGSTGVETTTYKVWATLLEARRVPDQDIHLMLRDEHFGQTLIVEFPDVRCRPTAGSTKKTAMRDARDAFLAACGPIPTIFVGLEGTATVTGVGFFDKVPGQKGGAPNGIELHPALSSTRASCRRAAAAAAETHR